MKLIDFLGMSQRQVILAVIVGVLLAAVLMWLAPEPTAVLVLGPL